MISTDFLMTAWVLIPATGVGVRSEVSHPKQYLKINNKTILNHTIDIFKQAGFKNILVIVNKEDNFFEPQADIHVCTGGEARYLSVQAGLNYVLKNQKNTNKKNTWILVHDAVRPCLHQQDLKNLILKILFDYNNTVDNTSNIISGGILAKPITSTLKYTGHNNFISNTVCRDNLWEALTPQVFTLDILQRAYENIINFSIIEKNNITDESYLIEKLGLQPIAISANFPNPKLTYKKDIYYITYLLEKNKC